MYSQGNGRDSRDGGQDIGWERSDRDTSESGDVSGKREGRDFGWERSDGGMGGKREDRRENGMDARSDGRELNLDGGGNVGRDRGRQCGGVEGGEGETKGRNVGGTREGRSSTVETGEGAVLARDGGENTAEE